LNSLINRNNNIPSAKKSGEARKQTGKSQGGLAEGIFARLSATRSGTPGRGVADSFANFTE